MIDRNGCFESGVVVVASLTCIILIATCNGKAHAQDVGRVVATSEVASSLIEAVTATEASPRPLTERALSWLQGLDEGRWRLHNGGRQFRHWIGETLVPAAQVAAPQPSSWPDAELLLAKTWWESRWRAEAVGRAGEQGLGQLMPRRFNTIHAQRQGIDNPDLFDARTNLRIMSGRLRSDYEACGQDPGRALMHYAGAVCARPGWPERIVLGWAEQIREGRQ